MGKISVKKKSAWNEAKRFSWYSLFYVPFAVFLGCKFGIVTEFAFVGGSLVPPILSKMADWCASKF